MRGDGFRVLVVGAGIAGTAAARALRGWGAEVVIVERRPRPAPTGTGIYLPGNAVRALRALELDDRVAAHAVAIRRQRTADHLGRVLFDAGTDELWDGVGPCLALARTDLHRVLLDGLGDVPVHWGRWPRGIVTDDRGVVVDTGSGRSDRYDLVLGADGVHSSVRQLLFGADPVRSLGQHPRRFLAPCGRPSPSEPRDETWSVLLGPGSAFLTIPIGNGQVYCYCDGPADDPRPLPELLSRYGDPVPALLGTLDGGSSAVQAGPIEEVLLERWSRGGVLLVGDAAHATSPNMAQGAAMALEDALVLADSLAAATGVTEALTAFERRRRPRTDWVRAQTHRRDRARTLHPVVRDAVLRRFGRRMLRSHHRLLRDEP